LIIEALCYQLVLPIIYKPYDHKTHFLLIKSNIQPLNLTQDHMLAKIEYMFYSKWIPQYVVITNLERVESFKENV
jgi:hypothetical protein